MRGPVRMGLAGAGVVSQRGIIPHLAQPELKERVALHAICDPVPRRAEELARRYNIPEYFTDYSEMLRNSDVHAVTIASPIGLHYEQGEEALANGKHVHFNKTMTTTVAEATELIELASAQDKRIVASPGEVLRPQNQEIRRLVESGAIGELTWALCGSSPGDYHVDEPERAASDASGPILPDWYFAKPGGGPLYDTTVYSLHALTAVLGPAQAVTAMSGVRFPTRGVGGRTIQCDADDTTLMVLDFGEGLLVFVYGVTFGSAGQGRATYFGTKGMIAGDELNGEPFDYPGKKVADRAGISAVLPHVVGTHRELPEPHVFEDIMQLVDWILDDIPSPVTAERARHVIDIIESAYRSAETGMAQPLTTTF